MTRKEMARSYINELARVLAILELFDETEFNKIRTNTGFARIYGKTGKDMDRIWDNDCKGFLEEIHVYINNIFKEIDKQKQLICAYRVAVWLDSHISYDDGDNSNLLSLWSICHYDDAIPCVMGALNTQENIEETHIWINPKFQIRESLDGKSRQKRSGANRNVFYKMNNHLINCSYFVYDGSVTIKNIILSNGALAKINEAMLSIAFSPLSDKKHLIKRKNTNYVSENGFYRKGMICSLSPIKAEMVFARTKEDWKKAGINDIDILFMPEMMATSDSCGIDKFRIEWIDELFEEEVKENHSPIMTVLPSFWADNRNTATIVSHDGSVLGIQKKYEPYVSSKDSAVEALTPCKMKEYVIVHIPNVHRIVIIICSEFLLDKSVHWSSILCACLGVSLIIVPSFSPGEMDFEHMSTSFNSFDTTVLWGNCCGAINSDNKGIGGCGAAGESSSKLFGDNCNCNNKCKDVNSCAFVVKIPLKHLLWKGKKANESSVSHLCDKKNRKRKDVP